jgi:hypothetical protein
MLPYVVLLLYIWIHDFHPFGAEGVKLTLAITCPQRFGRIYKSLAVAGQVNGIVS